MYQQSYPEIADRCDPRKPLSYRGIPSADSVYKLYRSILNNRLSKWVEKESKLADEQNGFRKIRSTTDHISSMTTLIEQRLKYRKSTSCAFIDIG